MTTEPKHSVQLHQLLEIYGALLRGVLLPSREKPFTVFNEGESRFSNHLGIVPILLPEARSVVTGWRNSSVILQSDTAKQLNVMCGVRPFRQKGRLSRKKAARRLQSNFLKLLRRKGPYSWAARISVKLVTTIALERRAWPLFSNKALSAAVGSGAGIAAMAGIPASFASTTVCCAPVVLPLSIIAGLFDLLFDSDEKSTLNEYNTAMDTITFFTGIQAFAAFLQVWQTERSRDRAAAAYFKAKGDAALDPEIQRRGQVFALMLQAKPHLKRLISNRLGRCEDDFEEALRSASSDALDVAAKEFSLCKCKILNVIRTAQAGILDGDLQEEWLKRECPVLLNL